MTVKSLMIAALAVSLLTACHSRDKPGGIVLPEPKPITRPLPRPKLPPGSVIELPAGSEPGSPSGASGNTD